MRDTCADSLPRYAEEAGGDREILQGDPTVRDHSPGNVRNLNDWLAQKVESLYKSHSFTTLYVTSSDPGAWGIFTSMPSQRSFPERFSVIP